MKRPTRKSGPPQGLVRLQRFLADAGASSRRGAEELITEGHVLVNDRVVDTLPVFVDPERDVIVVNGSRVRPQAPRHVLVNKPSGIWSERSAPPGKRTVYGLLPAEESHLHVTSPLDAESAGLLLMTSDGRLAQRLDHPSTTLSKTYEIEIEGLADDEFVRQLTRGVYLPDGRVRAESLEVVRRGRDRSLVRAVVSANPVRQLKRALGQLGRRARRVTRTQLGPFSCKGLANGAARRISVVEMQALERGMRARASVYRARRSLPRNRPRTQESRAARVSEASEAKRGPVRRRRLIT